MARLSPFGCLLAVDDFGAGFSSFYSLKQLPYQYLKIDGEFVRTLPTSEVDQVFVKANVALAQGLGKKTIAEFVEDEATLRLLGALGIDYAQGFYIGRPEPLAHWGLPPVPASVLSTDGSPPLSSTPSRRPRRHCPRRCLQLRHRRDPAGQIVDLLTNDGQFDLASSHLTTGWGCLWGLS